MTFHGDRHIRTANGTVCLRVGKKIQVGTALAGCALVDRSWDERGSATLVLQEGDVLELLAIGGPTSLAKIAVTRYANV